MRSRNSGVMSSSPANVIIKTPLARKAMGNHFMKSISLEKTHTAVSVLCYARNQVCDEVDVTGATKSIGILLPDMHAEFRLIYRGRLLCQLAIFCSIVELRNQLSLNYRSLLAFSIWLARRPLVLRKFLDAISRSSGISKCSPL